MITAPAPSICRHCSSVLDALTRRRGMDVCGSATCRYQATVAITLRLKQRLAAATRLQHPAAQVVVWLEHCEPQFVPVSTEDRALHQAQLQAVIDGGIVIDRSTLAESTADGTHPQGARLCAQCRGRCCQHGAGRRAFIDLILLQRWQAQHPGSTLQDAVQAYLEMLPSSHMEASCLYQTAQGCNIPRQFRADICNGFACDALQQVQRAAAADPKALAIAITFHRDSVERAAAIGPEATHALQLAVPPGEDRLA